MDIILRWLYQVPMPEELGIMLRNSLNLEDFMTQKDNKRKRDPPNTKLLLLEILLEIHLKIPQDQLLIFLLN
jgi:hypothetical protein